jgi:DNA-binding MarR family transcriptional regulator
LVDEVRLTFHALSTFAARAGGIEPPSRAVLEFLARHGPTTVPDIARQRGVSRQHIQTIVNTLSDGDLVTAEPNPAHQRSHLIALTPSGTARITDVISREQELLAPFVKELDHRSLATSIDVLHELRTHLDAIGHHATPAATFKDIS